MKRFVTLLLSAVLLFSCALAEGPQFSAAVGVPFEAQADSAVITLWVTANAETLAEAESKAAASVDAIKYALLSAGARAEEIAVVRSDVQADRQYHYNKIHEPELVLVGRSVEYRMTVSVGDMTRLSALVDAAVAGGLYAEYEVVQASSAYEDAYQTALEEAAKKAVAKARAIAKACGFANTAVSSVRELSGERNELAGSACAEAILVAVE